MSNQFNNMKVGVLMGGPSCEREISLSSGKAVHKALVNKGIDAVSIEIQKANEMNGYNELVKETINSSNIEVAFIALHGRFGEDGTIQKLLEEIDIPYTGSRVLASRLGMDKLSSKKLFDSNKILTPRYMAIKKGEGADLLYGIPNMSTLSGAVHSRLDSMRKHANLYFKKLGKTLVIKPCCEGSSIGLSIVNNIDDFCKALENAFKFGDTVIVEEYIKGREITVGILANKPLPVVEIRPKKEFFDFEAKYKKGLTDYVVPAKIEKEHYRDCQSLALSSHKALGAHSFSRVDMILSDERRINVLEVNTIPGLTETSLLPKAAGAIGIDFENLVIKLLESALW